MRNNGCIYCEDFTGYAVVVHLVYLCTNYNIYI